MPGSILHKTKCTLSRNNNKGFTGHKIIPQRYKFLHKNIIVLFSLPDVYAALTSRCPGGQYSTTLPGVCFSVRQQHCWELGSAKQF